MNVLNAELITIVRQILGLYIILYYGKLLKLQLGWVSALISQKVYRYRKRNKERQVLLEQIKNLEVSHKQFPTVCNKDKLDSIRDQLKLVDVQKVAKQSMFSNQKMSEYRDKLEWY